MDAKITVYGFCLVVVIAASAFWSYTMGIDDAEKEVALARQQAAAMEKNIQTARAWIAARKEAAALLEAGRIIELGNQKLRDELEAVKQDRLNLAKAYVGTIQRVREESLGKVMPEVVLSTGVSLKQARIQSLDSDLAVIQHSGGISKVSTTMLPQVLLDRFKFGYAPGGYSTALQPEEDTLSITSTGEITRSVPVGRTSTVASDSTARLGMNTDVPTLDEKKKKAVRPVRDASRNKIYGDPALWKNVQRSSIGRAYIPGQGWLRVGPDGPIPGSGTGGR